MGPSSRAANAAGSSRSERMRARSARLRGSPVYGSVTPSVATRPIRSPKPGPATGRIGPGGTSTRWSGAASLDATWRHATKADRRQWDRGTVESGTRSTARASAHRPCHSDVGGRGRAGEPSRSRRTRGNVRPQRPRSIARNSRADGVSAASRSRMIEIVRRTFHLRSRMRARVPARSSPSTAKRLQPATPWPRDTANFTASHEGRSRRRLGVMPASAQAASTAARDAEPSSLEIQVAASTSCRDILRLASWGGPTRTISSSTRGSASISGAATNPPTTPNSA